MLRICLLVFFIMLTACKDKPPPPPKSDVTSPDTVQNQTNEVTDESAPEWATELPVQEGYLYSVGVGQSQRSNIAEDKALMRARTLMAEKVHQSGVKVSGAQTGGTQAVEGNVEFEVILTNSFVKKTERVRDGKVWKVYVLLEMKVE